MSRSTTIIILPTTIYEGRAASVATASIGSHVRLIIVSVVQAGGALTETFVVDGSRDEWISKFPEVLERAGFTSIQVHPTLGHIQANYHKATTRGSLSLTLMEDDDVRTTIRATVMASVGNLFSLFRHPNQKIFTAFLLELSKT
jgi:hypothetical protein